MSDTIDRESEAYREAIEVIAEELFDIWQGYNAEVLASEKRRTEWGRLRKAERVLAALLAPSRVTCPTCEGTGNGALWSAGPDGLGDPTRFPPPCLDCSDGTVEGPPVIYRVLGMEQVKVPTTNRFVRRADRPSGHPSNCNLSCCWEMVVELDPTLYRVSDTRGPK